MKDFYYILGLEVNATSAEIREAYRKLSKKFHPDLNGNDYYFESRFKDIREAYETLNDATSRKRYDVALNRSKLNPGKQDKKPASSSRTKWIDIAFTLMLLIITTVFGSYVYRVLHPSRKITEVVKPVVVVAPTVIHHKKRRALKTNFNDLARTKNPSLVINEPKIITTHNEIKNISPKPVQSITVVKARAITDTTNKHIFKPAPVANNAVRYVSQPIVDANTPANNVAYIKANATGVVYLRMLDNYNSDVVTMIPDNSKIAVLEKGNTFYKISFNNKTGYVPKWTVRGN